MILSFNKRFYVVWIILFWLIFYRESGEEDILEMEEKDIGNMVCIEFNNKKKVRDNWFPGLVLAPSAQFAVKTNVLEDYLVRSFKDGK